MRLGFLPRSQPVLGVLPASALAEDHIILGKREGFPELPMVELVMVQASQKRATQQLADFLTLSSAMKSQAPALL